MADSIKIYSKEQWISRPSVSMANPSAMGEARSGIGKSLTKAAVGIADEIISADSSSQTSLLAREKFLSETQRKDNEILGNVFAQRLVSDVATVFKSRKYDTYEDEQEAKASAMLLFTDTYAKAGIPLSATEYSTYRDALEKTLDKSVGWIKGNSIDNNRSTPYINQFDKRSYTVVNDNWFMTAPEDGKKMFPAQAAEVSAAELDLLKAKESKDPELIAKATDRHKEAFSSLILMTDAKIQADATIASATAQHTMAIKAIEAKHAGTNALITQRGALLSNRATEVGIESTEQNISASKTNEMATKRGIALTEENIKAAAANNLKQAKRDAGNPVLVNATTDAQTLLRTILLDPKSPTNKYKVEQYRLKWKNVLEAATGGETDPEHITRLEKMFDSMDKLTNAKALGEEYQTDILRARAYVALVTLGMSESQIVNMLDGGNFNDMFMQGIYSENDALMKWYAQGRARKDALLPSEKRNQVIKDIKSAKFDARESGDNEEDSIKDIAAEAFMSVRNNIDSEPTSAGPYISEVLLNNEQLLKYVETSETGKKYMTGFIRYAQDNRNKILGPNPTKDQILAFEGVIRKLQMRVDKKLNNDTGTNNTTGAK